MMQVSLREREQMERFGASWAAWAAKHTNIENLSNRTYLDDAEKFIDHFLADSSSGGAGARAAPLRGAIVLVGFDDDFVAKVQKRTGAVRVVSVGNRDLDNLSVVEEGGVIVPINALSTVVRSWLVRTASHQSLPHLYCALT